MCEFHKLDKTFASDLYLIYKRSPSARVCISDKDQLLMFYLSLKDQRLIWIFQRITNETLSVILCRSGSKTEEPNAVNNSNSSSSNNNNKTVKQNQSRRRSRRRQRNLQKPPRPHRSRNTKRIHLPCGVPQVTSPCDPPSIQHRS